MRAPLPARRPGLGLAGFLIAASALAAPAVLAPAIVGPAHARVSDGELTSTVNASLREWMSLYQVPAAGGVVTHNGRIVATFGSGGMTATTPARIASLSKAITGICIAQLVDSGRLSFTANLGTVLARTFGRLGQPIDPRFRSITIEQLLMHRAGLPREARRGAPAHDLTGSFINILATPLDNDPGGEMVYSNIGYLTLGVVVQAVTGRDYESYCREAALRPMNATGSIDPRLRQRASSGGWRISAIDYARFIQVFEPGSAALGPLGRQWQDALPGRRAYGLGIGIRRSARGVLLTHNGRVLLPERGGSFIIKFPNGYTAVVIFAGDPVRGAGAELRRRLETAVATL